jgi:hypothetical protein
VRRGTAIALLVLAFLLGAVVGGLSFELLHLRRMVGWHHGVDGPPELGFLVRRLERRLDLSPEQTRHVEAIVERARDDLWELRRQVAPRIHTRMEEARAEIEELLTPEQREELRRLGPPLLPAGHHRFGHGPETDRRRGPPED